MTNSILVRYTTHKYTKLIKQFIGGKPAIYFLADKRTTADQLRELGQIVGNYFKDEILTKNGFTDLIF